ncbi:SRPBCC family protein [Nonomuraea sp. MCN248]|uniref:SRPBCC family protein n=1 Tax=Nonomuraea corallina TaxID=2989783 RepID=A0ABT4SKT5_9ACTN|nr:SRPBCC family protein [Nonomuraea corallina]MDA0637836.1 SRPBCC family protein [Nonomuraea corallina]
MGVYNVHERLIHAEQSEVGPLIDSLAGDHDALWPRRDWPPMRLDGPLAVGAAGGHGPIRYTVITYVPSTWVRFGFSGPRGFDGFHEYAVLPVDEHRTLLRHTLAMRVHGSARLTWPLLWRHLHDACVEDSLDRAEATRSPLAHPARRSPYVRLLRALLARTVAR